MKFKGEEKISVIAIVYNVEQYVREGVESLRKQSYDNLEIILVDDGSTDASGEICDELAQEDERIRVVHKKNGGLVSARRAGIGEATGEYTAFVDGDDWVDEDMYEKLYLLAKIYQTDMVLSGIIRELPEGKREDRNVLPGGYYDKSRLRNEVYPEMLYSMEKRCCLVDPSLCNKLFKTESIRASLMNVNEEIFYWGEDAATTFPCLLRVNNIYISEFCMYHHRIVSVKQGNDYKKEKAFERLELLYKNLKENFEKTFYAEIMAPQVNGYYLHMLNKVISDSLGPELMLPYQNLFQYKKDDQAFPVLKEYRYILNMDQVEAGRKIALYGAGKVGRDYYDQLKEREDIEIVLWTDKRYEMLANSGLPVGSVEELKKLSYDLIILAAQKEELAENMREDLCRSGIEQGKLVWIKPEV